MEPESNNELMVEYLKEKAQSAHTNFPTFLEWRRNRIKNELESGDGLKLPIFPEVTAGEEMAIVHKTVYDGYLTQDFTPAQALYLTAAVFTGNPGVAPSGLDDQA